MNRVSLVSFRRRVERAQQAFHAWADGPGEVSPAVLQRLKTLEQAGLEACAASPRLTAGLAFSLLVIALGSMAYDEDGAR